MMSDTVLKIEGMSCNHCKMAVEKALKSVSGVTNVQVDLAKNQAIVAGSPDMAAMVEAVDEAGFKVVK